MEAEHKEIQDYTLRPPQPVGKIVKFWKIHDFPNIQRVKKAAAQKETRKLVVPVVTIYAQSKKLQHSKG